MQGLNQINIYIFPQVRIRNTLFALIHLSVLHNFTCLRSLFLKPTLTRSTVDTNQEIIMAKEADVDIGYLGDEDTEDLDDEDTEDLDDEDTDDATTLMMRTPTTWTTTKGPNANDPKKLIMP